ncbi:acetyl-coenzyme A synthetase [Capsaspora owczarzaki ATCC 30864]|uniref:Acetyl-coenzyme A synthetase n=1 Tax=Capsaspora owczarzaki (strain ATCC 30864) TaxID=595528 RepID=A0A0D2U8W2_CAPO3|nr:acetyl-coenzyme A synthetase [Capsaspora owczarzaki ATCC 30864]
MHGASIDFDERTLMTDGLSDVLHGKTHSHSQQASRLARSLQLLLPPPLPLLLRLHAAFQPLLARLHGAAAAGGASAPPTAAPAAARQSSVASRPARSVPSVSTVDSVLSKACLKRLAIADAGTSQALLKSVEDLDDAHPKQAKGRRAGRSHGDILPVTHTYLQSVAQRQQMFAEYAAKTLTWRKAFSKVDESDLSEGVVSWFKDGRLNASENCIDRHLPTHAHRTALVWETDNPDHAQKITFQQLSDNVNRLANVLKAHGVKRGDRVTIYLPMMPAIVYSMLACARIGAVHSVVFAGFSDTAVRSRIEDAESKVVITADNSIRAGKIIPLKKTLDAAIKDLPQVESVLTFSRVARDVPMQSGRDVFVEDEMAAASPVCNAESMGAEDPLFLLYTSGSTGKPKGLVHTTGGYLTYTAMTLQTVFDIHKYDSDPFGCFADCGWITGHSYVVYGPLTLGVGTLLFESTPTFPTPSRYWDVVHRHEISKFYTSPTALRTLIKAGNKHVHRHKLKRLSILGSVGEPINADAWQWYKDVVGGGKAHIADTWWQTETGGIMIAPRLQTLGKAGAAMHPLPGVVPVLLDAQGAEIQGVDVSGALALKAATPGMARTVFKDHQRYVDTYFRPHKGYYITGDGARRDKDGHIWITGRVDDVINVSGHRLGTAEVENALQTHPAVAEAAVVGFPHAIKGEGIYCFVNLKDTHKSTDAEALQNELRQIVRKEIGGFASPDVIHFALTGLPKTRSGKVMRRILRKIAAGNTEDLGDTSTLSEPQVVGDLIAKRNELLPK